MRLGLMKVFCKDNARRISLTALMAKIIQIRMASVIGNLVSPQQHGLFAMVPAGSNTGRIHRHDSIPAPARPGPAARLAISEVRLKRNSKLSLTKDPSNQASSTPKPNAGQTTTIPPRKPPKKKLNNADVAIDHRAPGNQDMETGSSEMTPSAATAAQNHSPSGLSSCSDGAAAASTSLFTFTANREENTDNDHNSPHPWVTKLSKKAAKRARLSAKSNTRTVDSPPTPKTQERHIITLRPKTKIDVPTLPKKGLMEAITASAKLAPDAVSMKTIKETNTITVMVNSEATAQTLLGITEIFIAGKPPLPIQAYKPVGDNQIRGVIYGIDQGEDNVSLMEGLETEGSVVVAARPMSRGGNTALITFQGTHLPRHVWYRRSMLQVYPYRARAVTCSNCHKIGHKPDICPEPQVCSTCGKPHEETMDDQGNETCPSPIPFCQMCRKNGHPWLQTNTAQGDLILSAKFERQRDGVPHLRGLKTTQSESDKTTARSEGTANSLRSS
ncbi:hypothetical protein HPB47_005529 [Ixodes persulcatus]|uniref:Uncharacterized protein n=1 Tax=Ixodes persulcatus TaxID=34615 RepID=A0AC60PCW1_IXOPE|nr:hypothetical protein HPB47_005529 [Ixodes persulcatus]